MSEHPSRPFLDQTLREHSSALVGRAAKQTQRCRTQTVYCLAGFCGPPLHLHLPKVWPIMEEFRLMLYFPRQNGHFWLFVNWKIRKVFQYGSCEQSCKNRLIRPSFLCASLFPRVPFFNHTFVVVICGCMDCIFFACEGWQLSSSQNWKKKLNFCVLHLRAYFVALPTNQAECSHRVWSRNGRGKAVLICRMTSLRKWSIDHDS